MMLYKVNDEYFNTEQEAIEYSKSTIDNEYNNNIVSIIEGIRKQIWKLESEIEDLQKQRLKEPSVTHEYMYPYELAQNARYKKIFSINTKSYEYEASKWNVKEKDNKDFGLHRGNLFSVMFDHKNKTVIIERLKQQSKTPNNNNIRKQYTYVASIVKEDKSNAVIKHATKVFRIYEVEGKLRFGDPGEPEPFISYQHMLDGTFYISELYDEETTKTRIINEITKVIMKGKV